MTAPDDEPVFGFGAPAPAPAPAPVPAASSVPAPAAGFAPGFVSAPGLDVRAGRAEDEDGSRAGAHAQPVEVPHVDARPPYADRRRYFLSSIEPSGDFDSVIVAVTDGARRRYFTTRDGARLTEIDIESFDRRNDGGGRSLLELDERELGELEAELGFVRPVRGRDPIAEAQADTEREAPLAEGLPAAPASAHPTPAGQPAQPEPPDPTTAGVPAEPAPPDPTPVDPTLAEPAQADPTPADVPAAPTSADPTPAAQLPAEPARADEPEIPADSPPDTEEVQPVPDPMEPATQETPAEESTAVDPMTEEFEQMVLATRRSTFREADAETSAEPDAAAGPTPTPGADATDSDEISDPVAQSAPIPTHAHTPQPAPGSGAAPLSPAEALEQVALAKGIAFIAHRGQLDRSGMPYIDHPGRIAERFDPATEPVESAAAWLHDVLEDTAISAEELFEAGVRPEVIEIVRLLTRSPDVAPDDYYARIRSHAAARRVKLADIDDNTARWRLRRLDYDVQLRLIEKYRIARRALGSA